MSHHTTKTADHLQLKRRSLTFADIEDRRSELECDEGKILLGALPDDIHAVFERSFLETGLDSQDREILLAYLLNHSTITKMVNENYASSITFEYIYRKRPVDNPIDEFFVSGAAATGIYERLLSLKQHVPEIIRQEITRKKLDGRKFQILNIGSGPGHETIEMLHENPDLSEQVQVVCLDHDREAVAIGVEKTEQLGLTHCISFANESLQDYSAKGTADLILLIGILCPMPNQVCKKVLGNASVFARRDGLIIFSAVRNQMLQQDPVTDFMMRVAGWNMHYKEDHELVELAQIAGWEPISQFHDRLGCNCMTVARYDKDGNPEK